MAFYGVGLDVKVRELNLQFKLSMQQKGGIGLRQLKKAFQKFDYNGNGKLDPDEFEQALGSFGLFPKKVELQALIKYYDTDKDGHVTFQEFIDGLREELNQRRRIIVEKAFDNLDKEGKCQILIDDIIRVYDVSMNPEFIEGRKSKNQIINDFLNNFDTAMQQGYIAKDDFIEYYQDLSMSVPSDDYFVKMIESTWQVMECENQEVKATIQYLVREVRQRILDSIKNDTSMLKKIFSDFDLSQSGYLTIDEVTNMIAKLKIAVERRYVYPFFKIVDANNSGGVEYEEFEHYVLNNPY